MLVEARDTREWDGIRLRRHIGYVLQDVGLFPHMTVEENVGVVPTLEGWDVSRTIPRVHALLDLVGLPSASFAARRPRELSGGQRQRVGLARALAVDPPILLMDEPFGALDPVTRLELRREFLRIRRDLGTTVLIVTHDMAEAMALGTHVGVIDRGELAAYGTPEAIAASADPRVRTLLDTIVVPPAPRVMNLVSFWLSHPDELAGWRCSTSRSSSSRRRSPSRSACPAGILAARRPRLGRPLLALAGIAQTMPSLALLGFLLPLPFIGGVGPRTALVTLTLYALLPIVRTTVAGLRSIDPSVIEAGVAMGMTRATAVDDGGAAAGGAVHRRRHPRRDRRRRRHGDDRGGHRRRRARRVHLPRAVDGRHAR